MQFEKGNKTELFLNVLNILLVVVPTLGELERGWNLGLGFAQVNKFPPKKQNTKQNGTPQPCVIVLDQLIQKTFKSCWFSPILAVTSAIPDSPPYIFTLLLPRVSDLGTATCHLLWEVWHSGFSLGAPWPLPWTFGCFVFHQVLQGKCCIGIAAPA